MKCGQNPDRPTPSASKPPSAKIQPSAADIALFRQKAGSVQTLSTQPKVVLQGQAPLPFARQRGSDPAVALRENTNGLPDETRVKTFLETDACSYCAPSVGHGVLRNLRRGHWGVQGQLDLHGLRSDEARLAFIKFLHQALQHGWHCVRVIHGKGHGSPRQIPVLKTKVLQWLVQQREVLAFVPAKPAQGGSGALLVLLRAQS